MDFFSPITIFQARRNIMFLTFCYNKQILPLHGTGNNLAAKMFLDTSIMARWNTKKQFPLTSNDCHFLLSKFLLLLLIYACMKQFFFAGCKGLCCWPRSVGRYIWNVIEFKNVKVYIKWKGSIYMHSFPGIRYETIE